MLCLNIFNILGFIIENKNRPITPQEVYHEERLQSSQEESREGRS